MAIGQSAPFLLSHGPPDPSFSSDLLIFIQLGTTPPLGPGYPRQVQTCSPPAPVGKRVVCLPLKGLLVTFRSIVVKPLNLQHFGYGFSAPFVEYTGSHLKCATSKNVTPSFRFSFKPILVLRYSKRLHLGRFPLCKGTLIL